MEPRLLDKGDIVQIDPSVERFGGMLLIVEDPKSWGCQGYLMSCRDFEACKFQGKAYLRLKWEQMEYVGRLVWIEED